MMQLLWFVCLLSIVSGQELVFDESLKKACLQMNGQFQPRESAQSITGDKCSLKFNVATRDDDDAREFCELYAPWRLLKVTRETDSEVITTTCHVEATLTCANGWVQMFGNCFKMPDKYQIFTHSNGVERCKKENKNAKIAYLHHRYIVGVWKRYFVGVGQIWVDASESWNEYIQKTDTSADGSALALAFTGKHYEFSVGANSLVRLKPEIRLQLLCEYQPEMNAAEINYLGRRYSEIYYASIPVPNGILVRSASSFTRTSHNFEICQKTLKPFLFNVRGPFIPDSDALEQMKQSKLELTHLTRSGANYKYDKSTMDEVMCSKFSADLKVPHQNPLLEPWKVEGFTEKVPCQNMLSSAIYHLNGAKLKLMSDSRSLPVWCKLGYAKKFDVVKIDEDGFEVFTRKNGELIAHKLFDYRRNYQSAQSVCEMNEAVLSGINTREEADKLADLAVAAGLEIEQLWLGAKRRDKCRHIDGYDPIPNQECSRNNVIQRQNDVAQDFEEEWWKDGNYHKNPNYYKEKQDCLSFVVGFPSWAHPKSNGFLDDIACDAGLPFFCARKIHLNESLADGWS